MSMLASYVAIAFFSYLLGLLTMSILTVGGREDAWHEGHEAGMRAAAQYLRSQGGENA